MSRQSRARSAKFLTVAGLTILSGTAGLSGCSDATTDAPRAAFTPAAPVTIDAESSQRSFSKKQTIDGRVSPVWYQFDDPPMPALLPAEGPSVQGPSAEEEQPTVVLPSEGRDVVRRLPPTDGEHGAEMTSDRDAGDRYGVDSRYGTEMPDVPDQEPNESHELNSDPLPPYDSALPTHDYAPPASSPIVDPPIVDPPIAVQPSVELLDDSASTTYGRRYAEDAMLPQPAMQPPAESPTQSRGPAPQSQPLSRPSAALADEARPVGRFERFAPPEEVPASSVLVSPQQSDGTTPFVLPPMEAGNERSPVVAVHPPRHREMELINQRAAQSVRLGYELAHRGALYSAQTEFAAALRTVAQALDAQENQSTHVQALVAGLTALEESDDFLVSTRSATATVDVAAVVAKHRTPILKDAAKEDLTPITALQRYYTFAQEQLAAAVEHEPAASQALYGMGKVQTTLQASRTGSIADGPKAIALHQAALLVDDRNYMAANELGVLLARCGRYDAARAALAHSISIAPQAAVWRNLAAVHEQLGERALAANARTAAQNAPRTVVSGPAGDPALQQPVVWLDPGTFAQSSQPQSDLQRGQPAAVSGATQVPASSVPHTSEKKSGVKWPLW